MSAVLIEMIGRACIQALFDLMGSCSLGILCEVLKHTSGGVVTVRKELRFIGTLD